MNTTILYFANKQYILISHIKIPVLNKIYTDLCVFKINKSFK